MKREKMDATVSKLRSHRRLGQNTWLAVVLVAMEFILCCKMATEDKAAFVFVQDLFPAPYITAGWSISIVSTLLFTSIYFHRKGAFHPQRAEGWALRILFHLMWAPLVLILVIDCCRTAFFHPPPLPGHSIGW